MNYHCDTCRDTKEIDETLGGDARSDPHAPCPDCVMPIPKAVQRRTSSVLVYMAECHWHQVQTSLNQLIIQTPQPPGSPIR